MRQGYSPRVCPAPAVVPHRKALLCAPAARPTTRLAANLVWLASYPKSGNTWLRILLANYLLNPSAPLPLAQVTALGAIDDNPDWLGIWYQPPGPGADVALEGQRAWLRARQLALLALSDNGADLNLCKSHFGNYRAEGTVLFPRNLTRAAIYLVRDPRDVLLSWAKHRGIGVADCLSEMNRDGAAIMHDQQEGQMQIVLGSWSEHVRSWTEGERLPHRLVLRYEDLRNAPLRTLRQVVSTLGLPVDLPRMRRAVAFSDLAILQRQEAAEGFKERAHQSRFFGGTKSGHWSEHLSAAQNAALLAAHGEMMARFGYAP